MHAPNFKVIFEDLVQNTQFINFIELSREERLKRTESKTIGHQLPLKGSKMEVLGES